MSFHPLVSCLDDPVLRSMVLAYDKGGDEGLDKLLHDKGWDQPPPATTASGAVSTTGATTTTANNITTTSTTSSFTATKGKTKEIVFFSIFFLKKNRQ